MLKELNLDTSNHFDGCQAVCIVMHSKSCTPCLAQPSTDHRECGRCGFVDTGWAQVVTGTVSS